MFDRNLRTAPIFTTGMVAMACRMASRTVAKWCDKKLLVAYRVPGSADRRILRSELEKFMQQHSIPMDLLVTVPASDELPAKAT